MTRKKRPPRGRAKIRAEELIGSNDHHIPKSPLLYDPKAKKRAELAKKVLEQEGKTKVRLKQGLRQTDVDLESTSKDFPADDTGFNLHGIPDHALDFYHPKLEIHGNGKNGTADKGAPLKRAALTVNPDQIRAYIELPRHLQRFVMFYLQTNNILASFYKAGLAKGMSVSAARNEAGRISRSHEVIQAIDSVRVVDLAWVERQTRYNKARVIEELSRIAFAQVGDFMYWDDDGVHMLPSDAIDPRHMSAVAEISSETTVTMVAGGGTQKKVKARVRLHDKIQALRDVGRHLGMFAEDEPDQKKHFVVVVPGRVPHDAEDWAKIFAKPGHRLSHGPEVSSKAYAAMVQKYGPDWDKAKDAEIVAEPSDEEPEDK